MKNFLMAFVLCLGMAVSPAFAQAVHVGSDGSVDIKAGGASVKTTAAGAADVSVVAPAQNVEVKTAATDDKENTLYLDLKDGRVVIQMLPDAAPRHVARIKELVRKGFYDGLVFHRVIPGFMAQGGDPTGTGTNGSGQNIPAEFSSSLKFERGMVGMARANDPNSADSQFFIMFQENPSLNGQYTIWGKVLSGMEFVDKIQTGEPPVFPDKIVKMQIAADVKEDKK